VIAEMGVGKAVGFKPAGGVKTAEDAAHTAQLTCFTG